LAKKARNKRKRLPVKIDDDTIYLVCENCGEWWYPDARKWRTDGDDKGKVLRCPNCNYRHRIPRGLVKMLKEQSATSFKVGRGKPPDR
jgi:RNase P subunit RPR2